MIVLDRADALTLDQAWNVGFRNEQVALSDGAKNRIQKARDAFERLLLNNPGGYVYGSTAAPGARAKTTLSPDKQTELAVSQNMWATRSFGGGSSKVPEQAARLILLARLAGCLEGHGRVRTETAEWISSNLSGPMPAMPLDSSTGPGEVTALSWMYPNLSDIDLATGEIMALYNGSPCAAGFILYAALTSARRLDLVEALFALAIEAVAAPLDAYDPALESAIHDTSYQAALRRLNENLSGVPTAGRMKHQAPVSWRIIPNIVGVADKAVRDAERAAESALRSANHNPIYFPPDEDHPDGRALSVGGFHNHQASRAIDGLNAVGADLCALATKHTVRLLDGVAFGLPKLLEAENAPVIGTELLAWSQTGHAERARHAAMPSVLSIGLEDPGGGQSDVAAPVFLAFERHLDVVDALDFTLATLAVTLVQTYRVTGRNPPPALSQFHRELDRRVVTFDPEHISELGASLRSLKQEFSAVVVGEGKLKHLLGRSG